jgi:hypothetical protein
MIGSFLVNIEPNGIFQVKYLPDPEIQPCTTLLALGVEFRQRTSTNQHSHRSKYWCTLDVENRAL